MGLFGPPKSGISKVRYFITRLVKDRRQVLYDGYVDPAQDTFKIRGQPHAYHVDTSALRVDKDGHRFLEYEFGYFEPLREGKPSDPDLEVHPSMDAHNLFNQGFIKQMMSVVANPKAIGAVAIILTLMGFGIGASVGYIAAIQWGPKTIVQPSGQVTTYVSGNKTYTTTNYGLGTTTIQHTTTETVGNQSVVTVTQNNNIYVVETDLSTTTQTTTIPTTVSTTSTTTVPTTVLSTTTSTTTLPPVTSTVTVTTTTTTTTTNSTIVTVTTH